MDSVEVPPAIVRWTRRLEEAEALDAAVEVVRQPARSLFATGRWGALLRGDWLGHALHPVLTDVTIGSWTSATLLDVFGGDESSAAAQRLVGTGVLTFGPTAWTGWAEWSEADPRGQRVGLVHAVTNAVAVSVYTASWVARLRGRHRAGAGLALAGAGVMGVGAYLGGHLAAARKLGTRHPAYDEPTRATT